MITITMFALSLMLTLISAFFPFPDGLAFSTFAIMFWLLGWVIEWGQINYARCRSKHD